MASGVKVSDEVFTLYNKLKMKKTHRCMIMKIEEGFIKMFEMTDKTSDQKKDYEDFITNLSKDTCCFILLDMSNEKKGEKLFLITWCPDIGKTKEKMVYAASRGALHDKIGEGTIKFQANDVSDLCYEELMAKSA